MAERDDPIYARLARMAERDWQKGAGLDALLKTAREPFVLRGLVADWPLVAAGRESGQAARSYLLGHARDRPFSVSLGAPGPDGRRFYDGGMAMDLRSGKGQPAEVFGVVEQRGAQGGGATTRLDPTA